MSSGDPPIRLDRGIPFVDAVFRIIEQGDGLDAAIRILRAEEARHGVELVRREESWIGPGPGDRMPKPPRQVGYHELLELVPDRSAFEAAYDHAEEYDVVCAEFERLFPFLSATSLVLSGMDFTNDHFLRYSSGLVTSCSQRGWAGLVSCWANLANWPPGCEAEEGDSFPFYYLSNEWIEDYDRWAKIVHCVIAEKCKLRRAEPADADGLRQSVKPSAADLASTWAAKDAATIAHEKWYCMGASEVGFDRQGYDDENVVRLSFDFVRGLSFLARLPNLRELRLGEADVADLSALAGLAKLTVLSLSAPTGDLSPLGGLTNLKLLELFLMPISDLSPLKKMRNLKKLELNSDELSDLSALADLTNLEELTLRGAKIRNLSPLTNLQNLKELDLTAPEVTDAELERLQQALPNCEIV